MTRSYRSSRTAWAAVLALALVGCDRDEADETDLPGDTDDSDVGDTDVGDTDDPGDTDDTEDTDEPVPEPTWADASLEQRWLRDGFGEALALAAADLDGDGDDDVLWGGRGLAAVHTPAHTGHHPLWSLEYRKTHDMTRGGDNDMIYDIGLVDHNGDGTLDPLVITTERTAYLVDGRDGSEIWFQDLAAEMLTVRMGMAHADDDGIEDFFASGTREMRSGKTGEVLWDVPDMYLPALFIEKAELDGAAGDDLMIVRELDELIGPMARAASSEDGIAVYAYKADGTFLWNAMPYGNPLSAVPADLDDDGQDEIVIGCDGFFEVWGSWGEGWWANTQGLVLEMEAADIDADGIDDVITATSGWNDLFEEVTWVAAWKNDGTALWEQEILGHVSALQVAELDGDADVELLVGVGNTDDSPLHGSTIALDTHPDIRSRVLWTVDTNQPTEDFAFATIGGEEVIALGGYDTILRGVRKATGELVFDWTAGRFVHAVAAGDVDGDGHDEVFSGDDVGNVALSDPSDGSERWARRLNVKGMGSVTGVAAGDLDGDDEADLVAVGTRYGADRAGLIERFDADGNVVFAVEGNHLPGTVAIADLDGDGANEIVVSWVGGAAGDEPCGAAAYDADGQELWRRDVGACLWATIDVGDADGDGKAEIAYGDTHIAPPWNVAMLDHDGGLIWKDARTGEDSYWVGVIEGGLVEGGFGPGYDGHVTRRAMADGAQSWKVITDRMPDPDLSGGEIPGGSLFGAVVPDRDGDGVSEVLASNYPGDVLLIGGADGSTWWNLRLESELLTWERRHEGGPVAYVPASEDTPAWYAAVQYDDHRSRSSTFALDMDGKIVGSYEMDGPGWTVGTGRLGERDAAIVGGGNGVFAFEAVPTE